MLLEGSDNAVAHAPRATCVLRWGGAGVPETRIVDAGARESFERIVDAYIAGLGERSITYRIAAFPEMCCREADACKALAAAFRTPQRYASSTQ